MRFEKEDLTKKFRGFVKKSNRYKEAREIARRNSEGGLWLMGRFFYGNLLDEIHGEGTSDEDFEGDIDFIAEKPVHEKFYIPKGWEFHMNINYANPYFERGKEKIDLNYLVNFVGVRYANISNFLAGRPLNIYTIVFDCISQEVIGKTAGVRAMNDKIIKINNYEAAKDDAKRKGITIEELLIKKAENIGNGFKPSFGKLKSERRHA